MSIKAKYQEVSHDFSLSHYNTHELLSLFTSEEIEKENKVLPWYNPLIIINDLDKSKQEGYFENGNLKYELSLKSGMKHGSYKAFHLNGKLHIRGKYKNDRQTGSWKLFSADGELIEERLFNEGVEISNK